MEGPTTKKRFGTDASILIHYHLTIIARNRMSANNFKELKCHEGHKIVCVSYGDDESISVECEDCCEVIISFDNLEEN